MEAMGDWASFCGMFTPTEESDFMAHLLAGDHGSSITEAGLLWTSAGSVSLNGYQDQNALDGAEGFGYSQESRSTTFSGGYNNYVSESCAHVINNGTLTLDFDVSNTNSYLVEETSECNVEDQDRCNVAPVVEQHVVVQEAEVPLADQKAVSPAESTRKRSRSDVQQKNKRNMRSRKNVQKVYSEMEEEGEADTKRKRAGAMSSSGCNCSEEDEESNGSQEIMGESSSLSFKGPKALNLNGKTRAGRGAATDPQSLYARKRRERINERLKVLQGLVPNGTKVDISTMLEEAVQYVKFLQLQIKLLSSDDLWMYAPIAYNGMDIGLDLKLNAMTNQRD